MGLVLVFPLFVSAQLTILTIPTSSVLPNAKVGQSYSVALNVSGGDGSNYSWSVDGGAAAFPVTGLGFSSTYGNQIYITGTPAKIYVGGVEQTTPRTFTFNVSVTSGSQSYTKQFTLTVDPAITSAPTVSLGNPTYYSNGTAYMSWSATNVTSCTALKEGGFHSLILDLPTNQTSFGPNYFIADSNGNYSIRCTGPGGTAVSNSVVVSSSLLPTPIPTITVALSANPSIITAGQSVTITWSSTNAVSCGPTEKDGRWNPGSETSGYITVSPTQTTTYTILCHSQTESILAANQPLSVTKSVTVVVTSATSPVDPAIRSQMANARAQAELYYDTHNNSYAGVCTNSGGVYSFMANAAQQLSSGNVVGYNAIPFSYNASGASGSSVCHDGAGSWAAITSLKNPTTANSGHCVDSTGVSREATSLPAYATSCPGSSTQAPAYTPPVTTTVSPASLTTMSDAQRQSMIMQLQQLLASLLQQLIQLLQQQAATAIMSQSR